MKVVSLAKIADNAAKLLLEAQKQFGTFKTGFSLNDADIEMPFVLQMDTMMKVCIGLKWVWYGRHWFDNAEFKKGLACIAEAILVKDSIQAVIATGKLVDINEFLKQKLGVVVTEHASMVKDN
jgi:hypothetical protein